MPHSRKSCLSCLPFLLIALLPSAFAADGDPTLPPPAAGDEPNAIRVLLVSDLETTLSSQMNGTLGELKASLGQKVAKDALLAQLQCVEVQARAKVAAAELGMARQNLAAKRNLQKLDAAGELEVVLPEWSMPEGTMHFVYPSRRGMLPGVRALVDFLAERLPATTLLKHEQCKQRPLDELPVA